MKYYQLARIINNPVFDYPDGVDNTLIWIEIGPPQTRNLLGIDTLQRYRYSSFLTNLDKDGAPVAVLMGTVELLPYFVQDLPIVSYDFWLKNGGEMLPIE